MLTIPDRDVAGLLLLSAQSHCEFFSHGGKGEGQACDGEIDVFQMLGQGEEGEAGAVFFRNLPCLTRGTWKTVHFLEASAWVL